MEKQFIFVIQAYDVKDPLGNLSDMTKLELLDTNADSAIARAKELIKKPNYRVSSIIEYTEVLKKGK